MEYVQFVMHTINGVMFIFALYIHVAGYREVSKCSAARLIRRIGKNTMLAGIALSCLFIFLQADWVLNSHNQAVGDGTSWSWLLFDYALAIYLIIMGTLVRVFANWRGSYKNTRQR